MLPSMGEMKVGNGHAVCTETHRKELGDGSEGNKDTNGKVNGSQNVEEALRQAVRILGLKRGNHESRLLGEAAAWPNHQSVSLGLALALSRTPFSAPCFVFLPWK